MRKTILIITLGLLLLLSSCDNTTASGGVSLPDWMYSTEARTEAELIAALEGSSGEGEAIVSVPSGTAIELTDTIDVSGSVKLIISENAEITSSDSIFSIASGSTMTIEGKGALDAGSLPVIENKGTLTITGGSYTTTGSVAISGSGSVTVPESSSASFTVASSGTVFDSSATLSIKGGTYNVDNDGFIDLCAIGYMPIDEKVGETTRYNVEWSDAKIVADIINGLSQSNFQEDIKTIIDAVAKALGQEDDTPAGEGGIETGGTGEGENGGSTQPGTDIGTSSVATRESAANNTLTITGGTNNTPYTLTFDDYTHGFKASDFATVVSGTAELDIETTLNSDNTLDYSITCSDVMVEIDGHIVVINLSESAGKVEVSQGGTDFQLLIKYPAVGKDALRVKSDDRPENPVAWADVAKLLDDQASIIPSTPAGSGSSAD